MGLHPFETGDSHGKPQAYLSGAGGIHENRARRAVSYILSMIVYWLNLYGAKPQST